MEPINIYIGTEPMQWLPTEVLKYSILKRTQSPVSFTDLKDIPLKLDRKMYTNFSFYRFAIPEINQYKNKALYLDADIVVLCDIADLAGLDMQNKGALARDFIFKGQLFKPTSVMVMDCPKLTHWKTDEWVEKINTDPKLYQATMWGLPDGLNYHDFGVLPTCWNQFDEYDENTKIIHYTSVPTQPWKKPNHPFGHLFLDEMRSAIADKVISLQDILKEVSSGHIHPYILQEAKKSQSVE